MLGINFKCKRASLDLPESSGTAFKHLIHFPLDHLITHCSSALGTEPLNKLPFLPAIGSWLRCWGIFVGGGLKFCVCLVWGFFCLL